MKARAPRWPVAVLAVGLFSLLMSGCVVPGGGYGYHGNAGAFDIGYYEPAGVRYGGWTNGYTVGPVRGGQGYEQHWGSDGAPPAGRPIPSIPSRGHASGGGGRR